MSNKAKVFGHERRSVLRPKTLRYNFPNYWGNSAVKGDLIIQLVSALARRALVTGAPV